MMLAGCGGWRGDRSGQPMRVRGEVKAADAHDAGQVWGVEEQSGQQMFMMVCVCGAGALGRSSGSGCSVGK